ncbi:hypothetical protein PVE_R2G0327 [Pseudomonas veronii 1YdBTEX2]|uniref:Uncharacterized protein n=1 Tax=Pseudomonas veronii 1YdBTEX2 TaxID=1295141 RepID=A0A1D3K7X3_PSEVE|nr:hypothetical protein PVE_R2G0327 [Pseudomonas veronii 1YdBTEX2]
MKKAIEDVRSESEGKIREALLKLDDEHRAEWEEFQKWKAAKKGLMEAPPGLRNRLALRLDSLCGILRRRPLRSSRQSWAAPPNRTGQSCRSSRVSR